MGSPTVRGLVCSSRSFAFSCVLLIFCAGWYLHSGIVVIVTLVIKCYLTDNEIVPLKFAEAREADKGWDLRQAGESGDGT
jgi:hypothetical protein